MKYFNPTQYLEDEPVTKQVCCGGYLLPAEEQIVEEPQDESIHGLQIREQESDEDYGRRNYESDDFEFMDNNYFVGG